MPLIQGKGIWTYHLDQLADGTDAVDALAQRIANAGCSHAVVRIAFSDGLSPYGGRTVRLVRKLHNLGVSVWGWHYIYGRKPEDSDGTTRPKAEARVAVNAIQSFQVDGYVLNAECNHQWVVVPCSKYVQENELSKRAEAQLFMSELRLLMRKQGLAHVPVALSSFKFPASAKREFPWQEFLEVCDYNMPQLYWEGQTSDAAAQDVVGKGVQEHWSLTNPSQFTIPVRPVIVTGAAYSDNPSAWQPSNTQESKFFDRARDRGGAPGGADPFLAAANFYLLGNDGHDADSLPTNAPAGAPTLWDTIAAYDWPHPDPSPGKTLPAGSTEANQVGVPTRTILLISADYNLLTVNTNPDVAFGTETSPAFGDELVRMVVAEWPDLPSRSLKVVHAWMSAGAPDDAGGLSTHYEGRALHLVFEPAAPERLRRLARLASNAGFGWVKHVSAVGQNPAAVHATTRDTLAAWTRDNHDAEAALWAEVEVVATAAVGFWVAFLAARADNLDSNALSQRLLALVRAVSWASSRHGSDPLDPPSPGAVRDPMRIADPASPFWKQLSGSNQPGVEPAGTQVVQPAASAYFSNSYTLPQLPAAVEAVPTRQRIDSAATTPFIPLFPVDSLIFQLRNKFLGRLDPGFHAGMSYLWGTLWLLQQVNGAPNLPAATAATYDCGPADWPRLIGGAMIANGGRTVGFPVRLRRALFDILPATAYRIPRVRVSGGVFEGRTGEVVAEYHGAFGKGCWCPRAGQFGGRAPAETAPRDAVLLFARPGTRILAVVAGELSYVDDAPLGLFARIQFPWPEIGSNEVWAFTFGPLSEAVGGPRSVVLADVIGVAGGDDTQSLRIKLERVSGDATSPPYVTIDPIHALSWDNLEPNPQQVVYDDYSACAGCFAQTDAPANVDLGDSDLDRARSLQRIIRWVVRHVDASTKEGETAAAFLRRVAWFEGDRLTARRDAAGGRRRGFVRFTSQRARSALLHASTRVWLPVLADLAGVPPDVLRRDAEALTDLDWPPGNRVTRALTESDAFTLLLFRIALKQVPQPIPDRLVQPDHCDQVSYWADHLRVEFASRPDRDQQIDRFTSEGQALDLDLLA
jgi:hypothetical protein